MASNQYHQPSQAFSSSSPLLNQDKYQSLPSSPSIPSSNSTSLSSSLTRRTLTPHISPYLLSDSLSSPSMSSVLSSAPHSKLVQPLSLFLLESHSQYLLNRANFLYLFISFFYLTINLFRSYASSDYESTHMMLLVDTSICVCNSLLLFDAILYWCAYAETQYITWEKRGKQKKRPRKRGIINTKKLKPEEKQLVEQQSIHLLNNNNQIHQAEDEAPAPQQEGKDDEEEEDDNNEEFGDSLGIEEEYENNNLEKNVRGIAVDTVGSEYAVEDEAIDGYENDLMKMSKSNNHNSYNKYSSDEKSINTLLPPSPSLSSSSSLRIPSLLSLANPPPLYTLFLTTITSLPFLATLSGQVEVFNLLPSLFYTFSSLFPLLTSPLLVGYELTAGVESKIEEIVWGLDVGAMAMFIIDAILCFIQWQINWKEEKEKEKKFHQLIQNQTELNNQNASKEFLKIEYQNEKKNLENANQNDNNDQIQVLSATLTHLHPHSTSIVNNDNNLKGNLASFPSFSSISSPFSDYMFYSNLFNVSASLSYFVAVVIGLTTRINVANENSLTWTPSSNFTTPISLTPLALLQASHHTDPTISGELSLWHQLLISSDHSPKLLMCIGDFLYLLNAIFSTLAFIQEQKQQQQQKSELERFYQNKKTKVNGFPHLTITTNQSINNNNNNNNNKSRKPSIGSRGKNSIFPLEKEVANV